MSLIAFAAGTVLMMQSAGAELAKAEEARLQACVAKIETDPENAYEDGLAWSYEGNRPGARQCTALALIALGNYETGAERLESLATSTDGGSMEQRAIYLSQAGQASIMAGAPEVAVVSFTDALTMAPGKMDLLLDRASAYILIEEWDKALSDLDLALANSPGFGPAHQLRVADRLAVIGDSTHPELLELAHLGHRFPAEPFGDAGDREDPAMAMLRGLFHDVRGH